MKNILLLLLLITMASARAQEPRYQTYATSMTIAGMDSTAPVSWTNKNININLNYKTGQFTALIAERDFLNPAAAPVPSDSVSMASPDRVYTLSGLFPVDQMINQQTINAGYQVELQLTNEDQSIFETILFNVTVTKPGNGAANYRIFNLSGNMPTTDLGLKALERLGTVEIQLFFNAFWAN